MKKYLFRLICCCFLLTACGEPEAASQAPEVSPFTGDENLKKNIVLIFDDSGSMKGSRISRARRASESLLHSLSNDYNFGLYALNDGWIVPLSPIEEIMSTAGQKIMNIRDSGGTLIGASMQRVIEALQNQKTQQGGYGFYTIVTVTDGKADDAQLMFEMVDQAISLGINMQTIGLDIGNHGLRNVTHFVEASSTDQLTAALKKAVVAEIPADITFVLQDF